MDGPESVHDQLRPYKGGKGSYQQIIKNLEPLLNKQRRMQVSARVTVTPKNLNLKATLDHFIGLGFQSVGFAPMLSAPGRHCELSPADLELMLAQMIGCGQAFLQKTTAGERYPFSNMETALEEIHRGTHRPYPCGAGAGYFGVSASGGLYACHRFVEDEERAFGSVFKGVDTTRQTLWLQSRHVHQQQPCSQCWARYLCGGGCHHEVVYRGRPACAYIKGWLHFCLQAYVQLMEQQPAYFARGFFH